jgi:hypothetical protein
LATTEPDGIAGCSSRETAFAVIFGIEEHHLTADVRDAWEAIRLAATDPSVDFHSGELDRPCSIYRQSGSP